MSIFRHKRGYGADDKRDDSLAKPGDHVSWMPDLAGTGVFSNLDMYEKDGKLHVTVDAAGIDPASLEIQIFNDRIIIKSTKEDEETKEDDGKVWYSRKSSCHVNYEITPPFPISSDEATAKFEHGTIRIVTPRIS